MDITVKNTIKINFFLLWFTLFVTKVFCIFPSYTERRVHCLPEFTLSSRKCWVFHSHGSLSMHRCKNKFVEQNIILWPWLPLSLSLLNSEVQLVVDLLTVPIWSLQIPLSPQSTLCRLSLLCAGEPLRYMKHSFPEKARGCAPNLSHFRIGSPVYTSHFFLLSCSGKRAIDNQIGNIFFVKSYF